MLNLERSKVLNNLTAVQRKAIQNMTNGTPIAFTGENTINALIRKGVMERYTARQYWNGNKLTYERCADSATYTHNGTRLTALGFYCADALGYMGRYED